MHRFLYKWCVCDLSSDAFKFHHTEKYQHFGQNVHFLQKCFIKFSQHFTELSIKIFLE